MKVCPKCAAEYSDDTLNFCLEDGEWLRGAEAEPVTAILHETAAPNEAATRNFSQTTDKTVLLPNEPSRSGGHSASRRNSIIAGVVGILLVTALGIGSYWFYGRSTSKQIESIAVLPFENTSGNPDSEYLSDGLAESLIYRLSQLPDLKVSPRSSVFRYKGKAIDVENVGAELGVDAVMSGRITQRGENLTISVDLVDVRNKKTLWGEQFERKMSDLLATQREIASAVAQKLQGKLDGSERAVAKKYTESNEAYQLYLKGRYQWNKRTIDSLKSAAEFYNQAIEQDPGFALAYAGLAETYVLFQNYEVMSSADSLPRAKAAALRALELDDSLAEAHTALGWYYAVYEFDWAAGERELRRAIELNPNYGTAHQWLGEMLDRTKRFDEGLAAAKRAQESDPLSPIISFVVGTHFYYTRHYDDAIREFDQTLSLRPGFAIAHAGLCWAYERKGDLQAALPWCRKAAELTQGSFEKAYLSRVLARTGQRDEAIKILEELKTDSTRKYVTSYALAIAHSGLGNKDAALEFLEKDVSERGYLAGTFATEPVLDEFRTESRFKALLKRMNLPE